MSAVENNFINDNIVTNNISRVEAFILFQLN